MPTTLKKTYRGKPLILAPGFRDHSPRLAESNDWGLRYGRLSQWGGCVAEGAAHTKVARKRRKQRAGVRNNLSEVSSVICILKSGPTSYLHCSPTIPPHYGSIKGLIYWMIMLESSRFHHCLNDGQQPSSPYVFPVRNSFCSNHSKGMASSPFSVPANHFPWDLSFKNINMIFPLLRTRLECHLIFRIKIESCYHGPKYGVIYQLIPWAASSPTAPCCVVLLRTAASLD